jgi:antitoxin (DNA-binding transcriptional repressor) of toxin-antitoxin stability system
MTAIVNIYDAKTQLSRLVERAAAGEEILIARAGKPMEGLVVPDALFDPLPEDELSRWE